MQTPLPLSKTRHKISYTCMARLRFARTTKAFATAGLRWRPSARRCRVSVQARSAPSSAPAMRCIAVEPKDTKTPLCGDTKTTLTRLHKSEMLVSENSFVLFVSGRRPAFVSRGAKCEASWQGHCRKAASLLVSLHAMTMSEAKGFPAPSFRGRAQAPSRTFPRGTAICLPPQ